MRRVFTIIFLLLLSACGSAPSIVISLPNSADITSIAVSEGYTSDRPTHAITDKPTIEKVLQIVRSNNKGWRHAYGVYPASAAQAVFYGQGSDPVLIIWFGPGWVGVAPRLDRGQDNLLWELSPELQFELRHVLRVSA